MNTLKYLNKIIHGDAITILKQLPDKIADVGITSPPYNKGENKKGWLIMLNIQEQQINFQRINIKKIK
jgi:modification methylase